MRPTSGSQHVRRSCAAALLAFFTSASAFAQPHDASSGSVPASEARSHFDRGVTFYDEGDYSAALVEFKRAYALAPTWQVLFNVGQSYFQIRDYAQALVTLRRFVDEGLDRIPEDRRALVNSELADLANRVGHAKVACNVTAATVSVDDVVVGVTPLSEPVLVSVGVRKVTAVRAGDPPLERHVPVSAGETVDVRFDFADPSAHPTDAAVRAEMPGATLDHIAPVPSRNRGPAIAVFGVAIAGATVGAIFGGLALHDKSRLEGECVGKACRFGSASDIDALSRDGTVSTISLGVAAVGAVAGAVLWLTVGNSSSRAQSGAAVARVAPSSIRWAPGVIAGSF